MRKAIEGNRLERFSRLYEPCPATGCWLWTGSRKKSSTYEYGFFYWSRTRNMRAHRASWLLFRGEMDPSLFVCHHCDVPTCVNPGHLFLGTNSDNTRDKVIKGRQANAYSKGPPAVKKQKEKRPRVKTVRESKPRKKRTPKEFCKVGHPFEGNLDAYELSRGHRKCRICTRRRALQYWHASK